MIEATKLTTLIIVSVFVLFASLTMFYYWHGDKLFKLLSARHPNYYRENGEPMYFSEPLSEDIVNATASSSASDYA